MDNDDLRQMLEEVGRFARQRIANACARPESPMEPAALRQLTQEAADLGLITCTFSDDGFGLWDRSDDAAAMAFNAGVLRHLGRANAGLAFAWHRLGLARRVLMPFATALAEDEVPRTAVVLMGHYGWARTSLARWLNSATLQADELLVLRDWLDRKANRTVVHAPADWASVVWPVWTDNGIGWQRARREDLSVAPDAPQHGLDELKGFSVSGMSEAGGVISAAGESARTDYARLLKMEMLGLAAIGAGMLDRGSQLARDYASVRRQGGRPIIEHPAVQHMLADIEIARHQIGATLDVFARPIDAIDLGMLASARMSAAASLSHAANQVVQVHGGVGYMRDVGPEKLLRDANMLRMVSGGTRDIPNFLAAWTETAA